MALLPFANSPGSSGGSGTVTSVSIVSANGISGSVANPTTTPAVTLSLGAITPSSVNSVVLSGSSTPTLAVTGTSTISGSNTGDQTITLTGDVTGSGTGSFATTIRSSVSLAGSPTTTTQATTDNSTKIATTAYVTTGIANAVAGVNPAVAVQAATTAAGDTSGLTYNNGVSGIGATFTGSNNTALTIDGYTFTTLGQRLLVKNDTHSPSGAFNGVYYVTQVQTAILPPILTRALDYDTPSDINNTGAIPVVNGTANALTSWLLTSQITTVGTDPLTYSQFSYSPTRVIPPNLGGTGIANNASSTLTISGSFATTLTVTSTTGVTLPTSGTLYGTATGSITSSQLATSLSDETGSGLAVFATSPTLTTPVLGVASATSINKVAITAPATSATLTIPDGVTLTGPASSGTAMTLGNVETVTGAKTFNDGKLILAGSSSGTSVLKATAAASGTLTLPAATDTLVGKATTDTLTNKSMSEAQLTFTDITTGNVTSSAHGFAPKDWVSAWISWSPSYTNITVGNGTVVAKYMQIGKTTIVNWQLVAGTTSSWTNNNHLTLPATANSRYGTANSFNPVGTVTFNHVGGSIYNGPVNLTASTSDMFIYFFGGTTTLTGTVPTALASTDVVSIIITYEAA